MSTIFDRLAGGPGQLQQQDYHDWNQMVGSAPEGRFGQAVTQAVQQVPAQDYYNHTQPGVGGSDPFGQLQPQQRGGLAGALIGALTGGGVNNQQIMQGAGVNSLDPNQMSSGQLAQLSQWTQQNHPQAFGPVAQQYQQQPDILHSLLGNKALMMTAATLGASFLANQAGRG
ncbi:MAG: hypothetical protein ACR2IK_10050 [Chloroflexota bacterium]